MCGFAARLIGERDQAEDIVQEVFSALWTNRGTLVISTSLRAYLFTAVRNRAFNESKHASVVARWTREEANDDARELHPNPPRPDEELDRVELETRLDEAFAALPERCGVVMRLRWRDGLRNTEIAEALGISVKGVEQQLARGLRYLREALR